MSKKLVEKQKKNNNNKKMLKLAETLKEAQNVGISLKKRQKLAKQIHKYGRKCAKISRKMAKNVFWGKKSLNYQKEA